MIVRLKTDLSTRLTNLSLRLHLIVSRLFIICYRFISVYILCVLLLFLLSLSSLLLLLLLSLLLLFLLSLLILLLMFLTRYDNVREREKVSFPVQSNIDPYSSVQTRFHHPLVLFLFIRSLCCRLVPLECTTLMSYFFSVPS